jgi:maleylpyruvate isomerase
VWTEGIRLVRAPCAISSRSIFATCSYGGTAESGSITWVSIPGDGTDDKAPPVAAWGQLAYSELVDAAQRELSDQIDQATQRLIDTARVITEPDLRASSLLPGWTRAHVLAHLARNADALRNLLVGVRTGQDRPAYASAEARQAGIEQGAGLKPGELIADLADSAMALRTVARQLPDQGWQVQVRILDSAPLPAAELLTRRLVEVELHHCDLGAGYAPAGWPAAFAAMELAEPMRSWRQDRLSYPEASPAATLLSPARPPAPWNPNRPLPGSWLGGPGPRAG